ncbi:hypothetical protein, partial [Rhizobium johnstonii]|uniref:glycoside hydrolase family 78 protein n=1 Tax=Rhizobium johnstonii TaxID=3019933 RepID=UPI003F9750D7
MALADGTMLWASGRVASAQSWLVEHGGAALASNTAYVWRVRVWTTDAIEPSPWASG